MRIVTVSRMIAKPQLAPMLLWKKTRIVSQRSISG